MSYMEDNNTTKKSRALEDLVFLYLKKNKYIDPASIINTRHIDNTQPGNYGGDEGRDFEITIKSGLPNNQHLTVFGETVVPGGKYLIEVKYSKTVIDYQSVSSNLSRMKDDSIEGVFIVTNSYLRTPSYFDAIQNFPNIKGDVFVIHGESFFHHISSVCNQWPSFIEVVSPKKITDCKEIVVTEYIRTGRINSEDAIFANLVFYNNSNSDINIEIFSQADETWEFSDKILNNKNIEYDTDLYGDYRSNLYIPSKGSRALKVCGKISSHAIGSKTAPRMVIKFNKKMFSILSVHPPFDIDFQLPFQGSANIEVRDKTKKLLDHLSNGREKPDSNLYLIFIHGSAGVGKSRIIDEVLPNKSNSNAIVVHHTIDKSPDKQTEKDYYKKIQRQLKSYISNLLTVEPSFIDDIESDTDLLDVITNKYHSYTNLDTEGVIILVLEDLHNASPELCEKILSIINGHHAPSLNIVLIISARDDDSYHNNSYKELSCEIISRSNKRRFFNKRNKTYSHSSAKRAVIISKSIPELKEHEAKKLIKRAINGIQDAGVERIIKVSGYVPQHIVQCIEYLLDESLLAIDIRESLSIIDLYTFEIRSENMPDGMFELFNERFKNLIHWDRYGEEAIDAILTATFFGTHFSKDVCGTNYNLNTEQRDELIKGLVSRRFFIESEDGGDKQLQWSHENLKLFFENLRQSYLQKNISQKNSLIYNELFEKNAKMIYFNKPLFSSLSDMLKGDILVINNIINEALKIFQPIIDMAEKTNDFVSIDLNANCFYHIESIVNMIIDSSEIDKEDLIWKLLCIKTYIGAFHLGFRFAHNSYNYSNDILSRITLSDKEENISRLWLDSIYAHIHLDSGFVGAAIERFLHLQGIIKLSGLDFPELDYEVNNCLRLAYIYTNFNDLAKMHGRLSKQAIQRCTSENIKNIDLDDEGFMYPFQDRVKSLKILNQSQKLLTEQGEIRHNWHSQVGIIATSAPDHAEDRKWLDDRIGECWRILEDCRKNKYYSILPRIYLLISVLEYLKLSCSQIDKKHNFNHVIDVANQGLNSTEAYSIGFISWQLHNLIAVIESRNERWPSALAHINSAKDKLEKEGLTFIGSGELISGVPIVYANFIKINKKIGRESDINAFLRSLHGFRSYNWHSKNNKEAILQHAEKYHHISIGYEKEPDFFHLDKLTDLAVIAWF